MVIPKIKLECPKCHSWFVLRITELPKVFEAYLIPWAYMCTNCYTHMETERIEDGVIDEELNAKT